jgi:hypothetical protein
MSNTTREVSSLSASAIRRGRTALALLLLGAGCEDSGAELAEQQALYDGPPAADGATEHEGAFDQAALLDEGPYERVALVHPFPEYHVITQTPADHTYTNHENWDIDCVQNEAVLAPIAGEVVKVKFSDSGYGNSVGIEAPGWGTIHLNHLNSISVEKGCWVQPSDVVGTCGITGHVVPLGGGDGSHLDVYAVDPQGHDISLSSPSTWPLGGGASDPTCQQTACEYSVLPQHPDESYAAPYDCPGGVVMPISGTLDGSGTLNVRSEGKAEYGPGTYKVLVFDPEASPGDQCKPWNEVRATTVLDAPADELVFPAFASHLTCGHAKAYCIGKTDGGSAAHFCSGRLVVSSP